jgi:hypothetical protein
VIAKDDRIVSVWCELASGSGWRNTLVWVLVRNPRMELRIEAIQPDEQNAEMLTLFPVSVAAHDSMRGAVERWRTQTRTGARRRRRPPGPE